jgi:hypothetical protein
VEAVKRLAELGERLDEVGGIRFGYMWGADPVVAGPVREAHDGHAGPFPADQ